MIKFNNLETSWVDKKMLISKRMLIKLVHEASGHDQNDIETAVNIRPHMLRHFAAIPMFARMGVVMKERARETTLRNIVAKAVCRALGNDRIKNHYADCGLFTVFGENISGISRNTIVFPSHFVEETENWNEIRDSILDHLTNQYNREILLDESHDSYFTIKRWLDEKTEVVEEH